MTITKKLIIVDLTNFQALSEIPKLIGEINFQTLARQEIIYLKVQNRSVVL